MNAENNGNAFPTHDKMKVALVYFFTTLIVKIKNLQTTSVMVPSQGCKTFSEMKEKYQFSALSSYFRTVFKAVYHRVLPIPNPKFKIPLTRML